MLMMTARVDVIIPCYKYGHFLRGCVQSVLSQKDVEVRALILDDASPDQTAEVGAELMVEDERVLFRKHRTNCGHIATYNEGFEWATADFLLLLSADDVLTPGALARAVRLMKCHPEVSLTFGRQIAFKTDQELSKVSPKLDDNSTRILPGPEFLRWLCEIGSNPVATPTAVVRTQLQKELGGYRMELPHTADLEMWLRLATRGSVGILKADQAFKRMHECNMQREFVEGAQADLEQRMAAFRFFFKEFGHCVAEADRLENQATRLIAGQAFWAASEAFDRGDLARCQKLLDYAVLLDPTLPSKAEWSRLRWKRRLGPRVWSVLRPLADCLRDRRRVNHA
jgi:glycosyltransferase involved in cell wall biosynthesis